MNCIVSKLIKISLIFGLFITTACSEQSQDKEGTTETGSEEAAGANPAPIDSARADLLQRHAEAAKKLLETQDPLMPQPLDFRQEHHYNYYHTMLQLQGKTPESHPETYASLEKNQRGTCC